MNFNISIAPIKNCKNPNSYGITCVRCNKCKRFNVKCFICKKILTPSHKKITMEFVDVFESFACKRHEKIIKKYGKYEEDYKKYMIYQTKCSFLKEIEKGGIK